MPSRWTRMFSRTYKPPHRHRLRRSLGNLLAGEEVVRFRRRSQKQLCTATIFIFLLVTTIFSIYRFQLVDRHQLTPWNIEEQQSWGSFVWEKAENLYHNSVAVVYDNDNNCRDCLRQDYPALVSPRNVCSDGNVPDILLLIFSGSRDWEARQAVRKTWLVTAPSEQDDVQHVFLVGQDNDETVQQELVKESLEYGDILQNRYKDSYRNMTIKTITGLRWASKNCAKARYVMKLDSDIWINIPKWWRLMFGPERHQLQNVVFGHCRRHPPVIRTPFHRYGVSVKAFSESRHPSFCRGPSYAMSIELAKQIAEVSYRVGYIPVEDAYIGHCLKALGYKVYNPLGFKMENLAELWEKIRKHPCTLKKELYVVHAVNPTELMRLDDLASTC